MQIMLLYVWCTMTMSTIKKVMTITTMMLTMHADDDDDNADDDDDDAR